MKKKILFIISNMESGGVSKSMSSLLNIIDAQKYQVDVFITNPTGVFMELIPSSVNLITNNKTQLLFSRFPRNLMLLLTQGYLFSFFIRLIAALLMLINKGYGGWLLSRMLFKIKTKYNLAVDYNGQHQLYYLVDFIKADKKVSFFHSDYAQWDYYFKLDKRYYSKLDALFTISDICVASLNKFFPTIKEKTYKMENVSSLALIEKLSKIKSDDIYDNSIISVGHLCEAKGTSLAIDVAIELKKRGLDFKWYFLGKNTKEKDYQKIINDNELQDVIILLGLKVNPYAIIRKSKILVHLSKFEGKSIALDEAKILEKPILVTNFSTVNDQFENGINATICEFDKNEIANGIIELFGNETLRNKYSSNLKEQKIDNSIEIEKLYNLIP
jgi:glycosyltransferase involved in cell wall biosynthesis